MKKQILVISIIISIVLLISIIIFFFINSKIGIYIIGNKKMEKNNYLVALEYFSKIQDYKNSKDKLNECYYQIAIKNIEKSEFSDAIKNLLNLDNYKNSSELLLNSKISLIQFYLDSNEINEANNLLNELGINLNEKTKNLHTLIEEKFAEINYEKGYFKDAIEHLSNANIESALLNNCKKLSSIQGTFYNGIVINGWNIYISYINSAGETIVFDTKYTFSSENNSINISSTKKYFYLDSIYKADDYFEYYMKGLKKRLYFSLTTPGKTEFIINDSKLIYKDGDEEYTINKISEKTNKPREITKPKIGMSKEDAKSSSWGIPNKINKTQNKYGSSEQWVYGNGKYLYFDDGILTSIQE